jgi:hypothetical protein
MPGLVVRRSWIEGDFYTAAVAPDGRWLARGASDGPLGIWASDAGKTQTFMRVDSEIFACAWLGNDGISCRGSVGVHLFDFLNGIAGRNLSC